MKHFFILLSATSLIFSLFIISADAQSTAFYGMTQNGGANGVGTIFEYIPATMQFNKVHDFDSIDGAYPSGDLLQASDGKLYGLTPYGGDSSEGVLFVYDPVADTFAKKVDFNDIIGAIPQNGLIQYNGNLYGLTEYGGINGNGTLFEYNLSNGNYDRTYNFGTLDASPVGHLTQAGNLFFGLASGGGADSNGVIFQFNPVNDSESIVYTFNGSLGAIPSGSLILAANGKLYGTTTYGGADTNGVIFQFEFDPATYTYTDLYDFDTTGTGMWPTGSLLQIPNGQLYGMTPNGGTSGWGVIFESDTVQNTYNVKYNFDSTNGGAPVGSLIYSAADGLLYGMASEGGSNDSGVIFSFNTTTDSLTKLLDLTNSTGDMPQGDLLLVSLTTGISKIPVSNLSIYPNPATNELIIEDAGFEPDAVARIMDMEGRTLISQYVSASDKMIFNVQGLASGMYLVQVKQSNGNFTGRFVKAE